MKMDLQALKDALAKSNQFREHIIQLNREVVVLSKQVILDVHQHREPDLSRMEEKVKELLSLLKLADTAHKSTQVGLQEYIEARAYALYAKEGRLLLLEEVEPIDAESYLKGIADFSGELVRRATHASIQGTADETIAIYHFLEQLYDALSVVDLRGELRRSMDQLRWNRRKLEDMTFSLRTRGDLDTSEHDTEHK